MFGRLWLAFRGNLIDLTPLRMSSTFRILWLGAFINGLGAQMTVVAVSVQIFALSNSTAAVAMVGLVGLVPVVVAALWGGHLADVLPRRPLLIVSSAFAWVAVVGMAISAWSGAEPLWLLYLLTALNSAASAIVASVRSAIIGQVLPTALRPRASALNGLSASAFIVLGPSLGGVLVAGFGVQWAYTLDGILFAALFISAFRVPELAPVSGGDRVGVIGSVLNGVRFLRNAPVLRASFIADLIAMLLASPTVLLPAVASTVIGGGASTVGILYSAEAVGGILVTFFSGRLVRVRRHGLMIACSVIAYGLAIAGFGLVLFLGSVGGPAAISHDVALRIPVLVGAAAVLGISGAADGISMIFRAAVMQEVTPNAFRGRVQGIYTVIVNAGPRIGGLIIGSVASLTTIWAAPLFGGVLAVLGATVLIVANRRFRTYSWPRLGDEGAFGQTSAHSVV